MKIKTLIAFLLIGGSLFFSSCGSYKASRDAILKIEKGMSKREITNLLGNPDYRRFDHEYEQWEFIKVDPLYGTRTIILVDFLDDKVTNMDSFNGGDVTQTPAPPVAVYPPNDIEYDRPRPPYNNHMRPGRIINDRDFQQLYNTVKSKPFKDDQLELLVVGVADRYFSCQQCIRLMSIYTFDDDKLKVLDIVAPRIADPENYEDIVRSLSFLSSQDKVRKMFSGSR